MFFIKLPLDVKTFLFNDREGLDLVQRELT
jgi:hypothetical protein